MKLLIGILIGIVLMGVLTMKEWKPSVESLEPPSPFSFDGDKVTVASWSKFLKHLEITTVPQAEQKSVVYHTVGQIIALSNTSNSLGADQIRWVELDPPLSGSVGLDLANNKIDTVGVAYGLTRLPVEYAGIIQVGQTLEILRYGANDNVSVKVQVVKVIPQKDDGKIDVVFQFSQAQDWFPGTNCEIVFPILQRPVRIPTTAFIHQGAGEYIWKETAPYQFEAQSITVVDSTPDDAWVLGLSPGDRIIGRGGILLKTFLHRE